MKLWLLFYESDWYYSSLELIGIFRNQVDAVKVGVPMLAAKGEGQMLIQRWTLGNVGPDPNEETMH